MSTKNLFAYINDGLKLSEFSNKDFLPQDTFEALLTRDNVKAELPTVCFYKSKILEFVMEHAKKIFAVLVRSRLVKKVLSLPKYRLMDKHLPILLDGKDVTSFNLLADNPALAWFRDWTNEQLVTFCDAQWLFLAPIFTTRSIMEQLHDKCPLPFLRHNSKGSGGFCALHQASIQKSHVEYDLSEIGAGSSDEGYIVAIKELNDSDVTDRAYEIEIDALELARRLQHPHLVKFIAGFEQAGKHYMMFRWVEGGDLRKFWENYAWWRRDEDLIRWSLEQMKGIVKGLERLHNFDSQRNCRHGDLKPENILMMESSGTRGVLQIADMGLAKIHSLPTSLRHVGTITLAGTIRYQPPEVQTSLSGKRSRSYDIWSMGCILLELIIWLLFGPDGLDEFGRSFDNITQPFFSVDQIGLLQPNVDEWIKHLRNICLGDIQEKCVSRALRDLLDLVCSKLLVEDAEPEEPWSMGAQSIGSQDGSSLAVPRFLVTKATTRKQIAGGKQRANAEILRQRLQEICSNEDEGYFFNETTANKESTMKILRRETIIQYLRPYASIATPLTGARKQLQIAGPQNPYAILPLSDTWEISNDNIFARDFFRNLTSILLQKDFPQLNGQIMKLCHRCSDSTSGIFSNEFSISLPKIDSSCGLCQVISPYLGTFANGPSGRDREHAKLLRVGSSLAPTSTAPPLLSIVVGPGGNNAPSHIHRGFPNLPKSGSPTQARLLKQWIDDCDKNHSHSCSKVTGDVRPPSRLIDVGDAPSSTIRLDCNPNNRESHKYIALSHPWGDERHQRFCTTRENFDQFTKRINYNEMPQNFKDAVIVTRNLKVKYLWIDSICIIQGEDGDFDEECKFMEDYYSGAYCTISATSAAGSSSGFLRPHPGHGPKARQCHAMNSGFDFTPESTFYICNNIDDFARDVENSHLSTRGWIFQERALSRRIIHFAETQAYWECGHGVRCETMTKLFNRKSSFLSDPNFPEIAAKYYKGMRIEFYQYIYSTYSTLTFSHQEDRSLALGGLERRLARVYKVHGRYGILDRDFLHRSLLWQRNKEKADTLPEIGYRHDKKVPSWSWMAVMGGIEYMNAPFEWMQWNPEIQSPFKSPPNKDGTQPIADFVVPAANVKPDEDPRSTYDRPEDEKNEAIRSNLKCVIVGWEKTEDETDPKDYYVLLVAPTSSRGDYIDCKRVGVAFMTEEEIDFETEIKVRIV